MGIALERFYLFPAAAPSVPALLVRVIRPSAPNAAQPAVDLADALADAKAGALAWAWLTAAGIELERPPAPLGDFSPTLDPRDAGDRDLLAEHGRPLELWWTEDAAHPGVLAIGPGADEAAFWGWLAEILEERELARLRRPAAPIRVQLITEADARLVDHPRLLVDDVEWLSHQDYVWLWREGGLEAALARPLPTTPPVDAAELRAVKRRLVGDALARDLAADDRRAAAFRASDLATLDPPAALALIERLAAATPAEDDVDDLAWALAYALRLLDGAPGQAALIERWRGDPSALQEAALAELSELAELAE
ncbi:MAG: hypothetical protein H6710_20675 [Myxococcales bacterium]|nr:hypothetical protein [Myxococcales bacterium]